MLPEEYPLPGAERKSPIQDRDPDRYVGEERLDVGWHVVGAFVEVRVEIVTLGHEAVHPGFHVAPCRGVGVLLDHEARGSVSDEDRTETALDSGCPDHAHDICSELVQSRAINLYGDLIYMVHMEILSDREYP